MPIIAIVWSEVDIRILQIVRIAMKMTDIDKHTTAICSGFGIVGWPLGVVKRGKGNGAEHGL